MGLFVGAGLAGWRWNFSGKLGSWTSVDRENLMSFSIGLLYWNKFMLMRESIEDIYPEPISKKIVIDPEKLLKLKK
jgi:hypothetical protein